VALRLGLTSRATWLAVQRQGLQGQHDGHNAADEATKAAKQELRIWVAVDHAKLCAACCAN